MLALSIVLWSIASLLSAFAGSYSGLLLDPAAAGRGDRDRRPGDRLADRRLLPRPRAGPRLRLHPRRRDRGHRGRVHRQRQRREPDLVARGVPAAIAAGLLPRPRAVPNGARAAPRRAEPPRARRRRLARGRRRGPRQGRSRARPRSPSRPRTTTTYRRRSRKLGVVPGPGARPHRGPARARARRRSCATSSRSRPTS